MKCVLFILIFVILYSTEKIHLMAASADSGGLKCNAKLLLDDCFLRQWNLFFVNQNALLNPLWKFAAFVVLS
jgi:hypothetical protein